MSNIAPTTKYLVAREFAFRGKTYFKDTEVWLDAKFAEHLLRQGYLKGDRPTVIKKCCGRS